MSKHLKLLETALDLPLFARSGNRIAPTVEARALYDQVERTYRGIDLVRRFALSLRHHPTGEISIAAMPMLARRWLPEILGPFLREHQSLSLALPGRSSRWVADAVSAGQVEIGLGLAMADAPGVQQEPLMTVPLVCAMTAESPLVAHDLITPRELAGQTLITLSNFDQWRLTVETALERENAQPVRRVDSFTTQVACEFAASGIGIAIVDLLTAEDYAPQGLVWRRFEPALEFDIVLMRSSHRLLSRVAEDLADRIKAVAAASQAEFDRTLREYRCRHRFGRRSP